jgi:hypothetical protein
VPGNVKVSSSWKTVAAMHTRVGGSWKNVTEGYTKISGAWKAFFTSVVPLTAEYLVIAGGGGGGCGHGGGGGAGGYRTATGLSLTVSTNYTVTVGAGGAGSSNDSAKATSGGNSVFSTITSAGGGGGGSRFDGVGANGGSGGGGSYLANGGSGNTPSVSPSQGNNGGGPGTGGGGGGGASTAGANTNPSGTSNGGAGGSGTSSSITGTATTRGGGGGGGAYLQTGGAGGSGGGGAGGTGAGSPGTANTGGGGGGGAYDGAQRPGAAGGSGVVILSYPSTYDIRNGAGLTYTTSVVGSNKVTVFTAGTGNIQFATAANSSFVLLETVTLTSAQASVEFTDLATKYGSSYQHLQIRMTARCGAAANIKIQYNGDTAGNYSFHYLEGTGSSVISGAGTSQSSGDLGVAVAESNVFSGFIVDILDPFETTKFKTGRSFYGAATAGSKWMGIMSHNWRSTSAVTSIKLAAGAQSFQTGSRIAIYGLKGS